MELNLNNNPLILKNNNNDNNFDFKQKIDHNRIKNSPDSQKYEAFENSHIILFSKKSENKLTFEEFIDKCKLNKINKLNKVNKINQNVNKNSIVY